MATRDDGLDKLEAFIAALGETQSNFQQSADKADQIEDALNQQSDSAEDRIGGFREDVDQFTTAFVAQHQETLGGIDELIQAVGEIINDRLADALQTVEDTENAVEQAVEQFREALQETFDELAKAGYEAASEGVGDVEELINDLENKAKQAFDDLENAVGDLQQSAEAARDATIDAFVDIAQNVTETFTNAVEDGFEAFTGGLTTGGQAIADGLGDVANLLTEGFQDFTKVAEQVGDMLMDAGKKILTDTLDHMKDELMQQLEDAFKEMVEEFITALIGEIIESIAMMTAGSAITTAVGAYVPALATAKKIVGTINDLLDMLNIG